MPKTGIEARRRQPICARCLYSQDSITMIKPSKRRPYQFSSNLFLSIPLNMNLPCLKILQANEE